MEVEEGCREDERDRDGSGRRWGLLLWSPGSLPLEPILPTGGTMTLNGAGRSGMTFLSRF